MRFVFFSSAKTQSPLRNQSRNPTANFSERDDGSCCSCKANQSLSFGSVKQHFCSLSARQVQTMASSPGLLGPPELYKPKPKADTTSGNPFIDLLTANFNKTTVNPVPMGLTKNSSPTYLSSGNPCLDFFFQVLPDTTPESLVERLESAWKHNPLTTLKLVFNLRGVRGTGKNDKEGFYTAAFWLHKLHPKTLACNVSSFADFGYFKDLPEILYQILQSADVRRKQKEEWLKVKGSSRRKTTRAKPTLAKSTLAREIRVKKAEEKAMREKEKARELRVEKRMPWPRRLLRRTLMIPISGSCMIRSRTILLNV